MRSFLWMIMLTSLLSAESEKYAIQVISAQYQGSITEALLKKVQAMSMPYIQKRINKQHKVFLGDFPTYSQAASNLERVRDKVERTAFVRRMNHEMKTRMKEKTHNNKPLTQTRTSKEMIEKGPELVSKRMESIEPVKVPQNQMSSKSSPESSVCKASKKVLRESEISDALAFYRESSFYQFSK